MVPLAGGGLGLGALRRKGATGPESLIDTDWNVVSPEYFAALGLPIVRGRAFSPADAAGAPMVAVINERLAAALWPGQDPIGRELENGDFRPGREASIRTIAVVGVARDAKYRWIGEAPAPFIYVPYAQEPMRDVNVLVRRSAGAADVNLQPAVRQALKAFDPNLPLVRMQPLASYAALGMLPQRLGAAVAGSLGLLALLLSGIGLYGVTAFAVASRTRELGVRIALGADRARIMRLVLGQGVKLAAIGGAIGLVLSVGVTQVLSSLLFGVSPLDPIAFAGTVGLLAVVTLVATAAPARRAARVDPLTSLRAE
jgi:predicted permease